MSYKAYKSYSSRVTPQSEAIPDSNQVPNTAGGFAWAVDDWMRLDRFLILGSEGGTYYITERTLTKENADAVLRCIATDGPHVVNRVVEISKAGRAPKNDPAIFVLALAISFGDCATRRLAANALQKVCRIGTHLFHFAQYVEQFRGWGRLLRNAVAAWYNSKGEDELAYQVIKYRQRDGWSHRDLLRLSHPISKDSRRNILFDWIAGVNDEHRGTTTATHISLIRGFELIQATTDPTYAAKMIRNFNLPREAVPTELLNEKVVWEALLEHMPMTAMIRNLATMTKIDLLKPMSEATNIVVERLRDSDLLRKARVHPIQILAALTTYNAGHGVRGHNEWNPVAKIVDALDEAFYASFDNVQPTNKNIMLALDVSGSMGWGDIAGVPGLTPRVASAAMALVTANVEPNHMFTAFSSGRGRGWTMRSGSIYGYGTQDGITPLSISPRQRLDDVCKKIDRMDFGGTDCALPMLYALEEKLPLDAFIILTDSETWAGRIHPSQALRQYREKTGIPTKLIVVGMTSNGFSIADPNDAGMLDVVGFDTATPNLMSDFISGSMV